MKTPHLDFHKGNWSVFLSPTRGQGGAVGLRSPPGSLYPTVSTTRSSQSVNKAVTSGDDEEIAFYFFTNL